MSVWVRLLSCERLLCVDTLQSHIEVTQPLMLDFDTMAEAPQLPPRSLNQIY